MNWKIEYRVGRCGQQPVEGQGTTVNIGSSGMLMSCDQELPIGFPVRVWIDWPAYLDGSCRLRLITDGHIIWGQDRLVAVTIEKFEFRTAGQTARL